MLHAQATNCRIHGSDLVQRLKLDQRFCVQFQTHLTWQASPAAQQQAANGAPAPRITRLDDEQHSAEEHHGSWMQSFTTQLTRPFSGPNAQDALDLAHIKVWLYYHTAGKSASIHAYVQHSCMKCRLYAAQCLLPVSCSQL